MSDFRRGDGILVCENCGSNFSVVLGACPGCGRRPARKRPAIRLRLLCGRGDPCDAGGPDGVCCVSCPGFEGCGRTCYTAETFGGRVPGEGEILCEFMAREEGPRVAK